MKKSTSLAIAIGLVALPALSWITFAGAPTWPLAGGFHYTVDLVPASFPANSVWDTQAQYAISDWRDIGATSFRGAYTRANTDPTNHGDGRNAWAWMDRPTEKYLGVTFVTWSGAKMTDCDIWFNSRADYQWVTGLFDPTIPRPYWPVDFRNIARHECGHAIGFDHEERVLDNMNSIAQHGCGVQHAAGSGQLPHADDKSACRSLYPAAGQTTNLMATRWREPLGGAANNGPQWLDTSGVWAAGGNYTANVWLENQSNAVVPGGAAGVHVGFYLSTDAIISTADTLIGDYTFATSWPAHTSGPYAQLVTVPKNQPPGNYFVGAIFDNTNLIAEQFEADNVALLGQVTVTNKRWVLSVASANPANGVAITAAPLDFMGSGNGTTPFFRSYWDTEVVTLTAGSQLGGQPFRAWRIDGISRPRGALQAQFTMDKDHVAIAEYTVRVPGQYVPYGGGCKGSGGNTPVHTLNQGRGYPFLGEPVNYVVAGALQNTPAVLFMGTSSRNWGATPLPLDLTPFGITGCKLEVSLDVIIGTTTTNLGTASVAINVPLNYSLVGGIVYTEYMFIDPNVARPIKMTLSNSLLSQIGGDV